MMRRLKGFTLIELLIVVAIIAILAAIAVPNFLEAQTRSKVSRVRSDQRTLATALEAYYVDYNLYPAQSSSTGTGGMGINRALANNGAGNTLLIMPSFRIKRNAGDQIMTLTTPVAYISSFFPDPFADTKGAIFAYSIARYGLGWILWSFGPDADEAVPQSTANQMIACGGDVKVHQQETGTSPFNFPYVSESYYNGTGMGTVPSPLLVGVTYDPTNGTTSNGDVWKIKQ
jgi:prepilin-type N-terminal cleavage/methylation domain-containing protein